MSHKNDIRIRKQVIHTIQANIENVHSNILNIKNIYTNKLCVFGFTVLSSIFLKSKTFIQSNLTLRLLSNLLIKSHTTINSKLVLKSKTNINIKSQNSVKGNIIFKTIERLILESQTYIRIGKHTILRSVDDFILSALDNYILGYVDIFSNNGLEVKLNVHTNIKSKSSIGAFLDLSMYSAYKLSKHDNKTIRHMDFNTLEDLDMILT